MSETALTRDKQEVVLDGLCVELHADFGYILLFWFDNLTSARFLFEALQNVERIEAD